MEKMGEGSIPSEQSGYIVRPAVSLCSTSEMFIGIKYKKETLMETGRSTHVTKNTLNLKLRLTLKARLTVALVAACLLAAPSTRAHKIIANQSLHIYGDNARF